MMIRPEIKWIMSLGCLLCAGCATVAPHAEIEANSLAKAGAPAASSTVMRTADAIAMGEAGERSNDPSALARAAGMLDALGARPTGESEEDDVARKWIDLAVAHDPNISVPVYRGRALGPAYRKGTVSAGSEVTFQQIFLAGKKASVALVPVSKDVLSISVESGAGERLCYRTVFEKPDGCEWLPLFTDRFLIRVITKARKPVHYYLVSN